MSAPIVLREPIHLKCHPMLELYLLKISSAYLSYEATLHNIKKDAAITRKTNSEIGQQDTNLDDGLVAALGVWTPFHRV